ncbi:hypothetical protein RHGRI_014385 [Rhododendron griersonianum]|uniref:3'-5' exonuclease domain-containing protein n=1 Tax=Rhododendron griersonianum TaxID=479676 RepID=A0AAV6K952_9ERIC|nr:hypothetical protein RHGRI_014385 [Rhododendron griersonianum]
MVSTDITELRCRIGTYSAVGLALMYPFQRGPPYSDQPALMLQLGVGTHCLMIQLSQRFGILKCLNEFLADPEICFVGVGPSTGSLSDLTNHYQLESKNYIGVNELAAKKLKKPDLLGLGLKAIAAEVGVSLEESPTTLQDINWCAKAYSDEQIKRAVHAANLVGTKLLCMPKLP